MKLGRQREREEEGKRREMPEQLHVKFSRNDLIVKTVFFLFFFFMFNESLPGGSLNISSPHGREGTRSEQGDVC